MKSKLARNLLVLVVLTAWTTRESECFIPAELFTFVLEQAGSHKVIDFGQVSETVVHEELLRRGAINSITQYLIDLKAAGSRVSRNNLTTYYGVKFPLVN